MYPRTVERESVKVSKNLLKMLRRIADRDGFVLSRLIERLIESGIKAEKLK